MLDVTPEAKHWLQELLQRALTDHPRIDAVPSLAFRIVHDEGESTSDLGLVLDEPRAADDVVEHGDAPLLIVDAAVSELLTGLTLDLVDTDQGARLGLRESAEAPGGTPGASGAAS